MLLNTFKATPFFFLLCFALGARDLGAGFEKTKNTPPYVHVHTVDVCCDIFMVQSRSASSDGCSGRQHASSSL